MTAEEAKGVARAYFERVLNRRDLAACDELLAPNYVDHDAPADTPPGPGSVKAYLAGFLDDYPDMRVEIAEMLAEGDRVAARLTWRGHRRGTGEIYHLLGIVILRLDERGRLAERWSAYTRLA